MEKHTLIKEWLKASGRSSKWLADQLGFTDSHMSRICNGASVTKTTALALEKVSDGGIPASTWDVQS